MKRITIRFFIAILIFVVLYSCGTGSPGQNSETNTLTAADIKLTIDTFSAIPDEIDGCSCYFSNNSKEFGEKVYIYVNDYAQTSFLKINGKLTKFEQTEYKKIDDKTVEAKAKSGDYELTIKVVHGEQSGDEASLQLGTITLTDKKGHKITKTFYGECGC